MNRYRSRSPTTGQLRPDEPAGRRYGGGGPAVSRFGHGERVLVRAHFPPGHIRAPWYTRGHTGEVVQITGPFPNAEERAYGRPGAPEPLYRVRFRQRDLWPDYEDGADDTLVADIYEHWLEPGDRQ
ncbi:MAG: nitrile hydratase subunit beta [Rhodospirillaceae bacterium]|nr:nitrile hydratase subunit beta [Rhodospirillaceae bacterium]